MLSCHAEAGSVKRLAAELQGHAEGWTSAEAGNRGESGESGESEAGAAGSERVGRVLGALERAGLRGCALNALSVLLFTQRLSEGALRSWGRAEEAAAARAQAQAQAHAHAQAQAQAQAHAQA